eukprot:CAMPEP_0194757912 /NCGR_PEP_ID=MMETSP0323_2-20130528/11317_1 /TAXON_ID=2866 ORGANISM="Crypthecodinium cohnii, Strain Seligo" /NCGR_SAMPLE_ID=MMETSP0323_2 /ASSEMBLY_ACC=CAM_ASM_000346 /LENGTH=153 /DNA_ID=CAMNT_0039678049 /DNA_START=152 /DNA_END=610 /DNA_ORIENTATION=-
MSIQTRDLRACELAASFQIVQILHLHSFGLDRLQHEAVPSFASSSANLRGALLALLMSSVLTSILVAEQAVDSTQQAASTATQGNQREEADKEEHRRHGHSRQHGSPVDTMDTDSSTVGVCQRAALESFAASLHGASCAAVGSGHEDGRVPQP